MKNLLSTSKNHASWQNVACISTWQYSAKVISDHLFRWSCGLQFARLPTRALTIHFQWPLVDNCNPFTTSLVFRKVSQKCNYWLCVILSRSAEGLPLQSFCDSASELPCPRNCPRSTRGKPPTKPLKHPRFCAAFAFPWFPNQ